LTPPSTTTPADPAEPVAVEARWPVAAAILAFIAISVALRIVEPDREALGPDWLIPSIEIAMLVVLLAADPARIVARSRWLRRLSIVLILALTAAAVLSTGILINDLVRGEQVTNSAGPLLASGAVIWLGNLLVFSLVYWIFDSGGPLARYRGDRRYPDFAFTQHQAPELAPPGWRPRYVDYLVLGLTTNTAFSPTDVMPMAAWAKATMALQSVISLVVVGLVIARAVNVFT
jgi:hypothetical protein